MYGEHGAALGQTAAVGARRGALPHPEDARPAARQRGLRPRAETVRAPSPPRSGRPSGRRLVDRVPAAYITREAWLGGLRFHVDERVLIPRSYFVEILPGQVDPWLRDPSRVTRVADVCTGSGCLAVLLARHFRRRACRRDRPLGGRPGGRRDQRKAPQAWRSACGSAGATCSSPPGAATTSSYATRPTSRRRTWTPFPRSSAGSRASRSTAARTGLGLVRRLVRQAAGA
jgi:hypothetical protein